MALSLEVLEKMLIEAQDEVERLEDAIEDYWQQDPEDDEEDNE